MLLVSFLPVFQMLYSKFIIFAISILTMFMYVHITHNNFIFYIRNYLSMSILSPLYVGSDFTN
jgi:hypothetical protein